MSGNIFLWGGSGFCGEVNWRLYWILNILSLDLGLGVRLEESIGGERHLFLQEKWTDILQDLHLANFLALPWKGLLQ